MVQKGIILKETILDKKVVLEKEVKLGLPTINKMVSKITTEVLLKIKIRITEVVLKITELSRKPSKTQYLKYYNL